MARDHVREVLIATGVGVAVAAGTALLMFTAVALLGPRPSGVVELAVLGACLIVTSGYSGILLRRYCGASWTWFTVLLASPGSYISALLMIVMFAVSSGGPLHGAWILLVLLMLGPALISVPAVVCGWRPWSAPDREAESRTFCAECGYNLTGNVSGVCPECGRQIELTPDEEGECMGSDADS